MLRRDNTAVIAYGRLGARGKGDAVLRGAAGSSTQKKLAGSRTATSALSVALLALALPAPLAGQGAAAVGAPCDDAAGFLPPAEQQYCRVLAQTVVSSQPQLGLLLSGAPRPGGAVLIATGTTAPPVRLLFTVSGVRAHLPDVRSRDAALTGVLEQGAPALSAAAALRVFRGVSGGTFNGAGALDVSAQLVLLPVGLMDIPGMAADDALLGYSGGAALTLLREAGHRPALDLSVMHYRMPRAAHGDVCPAGAGADLITGSGTGYNLAAGLCSAPGDEGEFSADLVSTGTRLRLGRRFGPVLVMLSGGLDRDVSDVAFGLRAAPVLPLLGQRDIYVRGSDLQLVQTRSAAAAELHYARGMFGFSAAAGWGSGGGVVPGVEDTGMRYNARRGTVHASVGVTLGL